MNGHSTNPSFIARNRYWIMAAAIILFMPPLSFLFQFTGDSNFCGTWCPRMFFVWRKGMTLDSYFGGFLRSHMGVLMVDAVLISTFFFGRHWCSHLCPVGAGMELGSRMIPRALKVDFSIIPAPAFRYGYLTVYFLAPAFGLGSLCCSYCHFATLPRLFGSLFSPADLAYFLRTAGLMNLGLLVFIGFFSRGGKAYCNLFCPVGALDALVNRLSAAWGRRMAVSAHQCNGCGKCVGKCPAWAIELNRKNNKAEISQFSCFPCRVCESVCPNGAITYSKSMQAKKTEYLVGVYETEN